MDFRRILVVYKKLRRPKKIFGESQSEVFDAARVTRLLINHTLGASVQKYPRRKKEEALFAGKLPFLVVGTSLVSCVERGVQKKVVVQ